MLTTKQKMFLARLAHAMVMGGRKLTGQGAQARVRRSGVQWELDLHEGIDFSIWLLGSFEPGTVRCYRKLIKAGDIVLDIGANIGAHTLLLAQAVGPEGKVIAFEPTDYAFGKLSRNAALNPALAGRIECRQYMLVAAEAQDIPAASLYSSWPLQDESDRHGLHEGRLMTTSRATPRTLDSAIASLGLGRIDCIKLDIDGFECAMLRGARTVLTRWHPTIIMELAPYALEEQGASLGELVGQLKELGYNLYDATTGNPIEQDAARLAAVIPHGASLNVVARVAAGPTIENQAAMADPAKSHRGAAV